MQTIHCGSKPTRTRSSTSISGQVSRLCRDENLKIHATCPYIVALFEKY